MNQDDSIRQYQQRVLPLLNMIGSTVNAPVPEDRDRALLTVRRGLRVVALCARQIRDIAVDTETILKAEQAERAADTESTEEEAEQEEPKQLPTRRGRSKAA